jgi:maltose O-acetyltransferase
MAEKTEKNKMLGGELYRASDKELLDERRHAQQLLARYNGARTVVTICVQPCFGIS